MSANFSHQLECEFTPLLKPDETITALGIFKKDPSISRLLLTRGIARYGAREFHAAGDQSASDRPRRACCPGVRSWCPIQLMPNSAMSRSPGITSTRRSWWPPSSF